MATKKYDMVINAGEYTNGQGETKKRWVNIGAVMQSDNGFFALLDPGVNLAAYKQEGKDRVMVSLFEKQDKQQSQNQPAQPNQGFDDFDDDIPF